MAEAAPVPSPPAPVPPPPLPPKPGVAPESLHPAACASTLEGSREGREKGVVVQQEQGEEEEEEEKMTMMQRQEVAPVEKQDLLSRDASFPACTDLPSDRMTPISLLPFRPSPSLLALSVSRP